MAKRKRENKRLKSLILLLFLTIVLLSTSTYAWFTANRTVTIEAIDISVAASSGLQISTNAKDWKTLITNDDIINVTDYTNAVNQVPNVLAPVSTTGAVSNGRMVFFDGAVEGDENNGGAMSLTTSVAHAEVHESGDNTVGHFVAFDIFLKTEDNNVPIYLTNGSGVTVTEGEADKGLQNAARYGFIIEGNVASTASYATAQAQLSGTSSIIVEPNYDAHTINGVNNALSYYDKNDVQEASSGAAYVPYVGVKAAIATPIILNRTNAWNSYDSSKFGSVTNLLKTNVAYSDGGSGYIGIDASNTQADHLLQVFTLRSGITKIRVYMWVEGQDIDCENAASGAFISYKMGFSLDDDD